MDLTEIELLVCTGKDHGFGSETSAPKNEDYYDLILALGSVKMKKRFIMSLVSGLQR
jgi:hypothetical protein